MKEFVRVEIPGIGTRSVQIDRRRGEALVDLQAVWELDILVARGHQRLCDLARQLGSEEIREVLISYRVRLGPEAGGELMVQPLWRECAS